MEETICSFGTFASPVKANSRLGDFKILSRLGEGAFSTVYKVERQTDKRIYALKKVRLSRLSDKEKANALNEIRILASIHSRHVIEYRDSFFDESSDSLCIVMEYAGGGDLLSKLNQYKALNAAEKSANQAEEAEQSSADEQQSRSSSSPSKQSQYQSIDGPVIAPQPPLPVLKFHMEEHIIWEYLRQTTEGLRCLHAINILHRDLKCANLFISSDNSQLKIGDLNVSVVTHPSKSMAKSQTGTPYYTAPEIWRGQTYSRKSDIWSIGCIVYELCAQVPPFRARTIEALFMSILKGEFHRIPDCYSNELAEIVRICLDQDPLKRPSCDDILAVVSKNNARFTPKTPNRNNSAAAKSAQHLIDTINVPSNMKQLGDLLPKPNYDYEGQLATVHHVNQLPKITEFDENFYTAATDAINIDDLLANNQQFQSQQQNLRAQVMDGSLFQNLLNQGVTPNNNSNSNNDPLNKNNNGDDYIHLNGVNTPRVDLPLQFAVPQKQEDNRKRGDLYHDLVRDSPIRMNLKKVPMDSSSNLTKTNKPKNTQSNNNQSKGSHLRLPDILDSRGRTACPRGTADDKSKQDGLHSFTGYSFNEEGGIQLPRESINYSTGRNTTTNGSRRQFTRGSRSFTSYIKSEGDSSVSPTSLTGKYSSIKTYRSVNAPPANSAVNVRKVVNYSEYQSAPSVTTSNGQVGALSPAIKSQQQQYQQQNSFSQVVKRYLPKATLNKSGQVVVLSSDRPTSTTTRSSQTFSPVVGYGSTSSRTPTASNQINTSFRDYKSQQYASTQMAADFIAVDTSEARQKHINVSASPQVAYYLQNTKENSVNSGNVFAKPINYTSSPGTAGLLANNNSKPLENITNAKNNAIINNNYHLLIKRFPGNRGPSPPKLAGAIRNQNSSNASVKTTQNKNNNQHTTIFSQQNQLANGCYNHLPINYSHSLPAKITGSGPLTTTAAIGMHGYKTNQQLPANAFEKKNTNQTSYYCFR